MGSGLATGGPAPQGRGLMFLSSQVENGDARTLSGESEMELFTLVSHHLCPYVQRAAIALDGETAISVRTDLGSTSPAKPEWFTKISPLGKVPVLIVERR